MSQEDDIFEIVSNVARECDDVVLAYLFGSQGRGQAGPLSDVDVGVLGSS